MLDSLGNTVPFMLSAYGDLLVYKQENNKWRVDRMKVAKIFEGLNCVNEFITWLSASGAVQIEVDTKDLRGHWSHKTSHQ